MFLNIRLKFVLVCMEIVIIIMTLYQIEQIRVVIYIALIVVQWPCGMCD